MDNLHNKKVKINTNRILDRKLNYDPLFVKFITDNKDTIFTAMLEENHTETYNLKEEPIWLFHKDDLIEVK